MQTLNLTTYAQWKATQAYMLSKGKGSVFYLQTGSTLTIYLVDLNAGLIFSHAIPRVHPANADETNFDSAFLPSATAVANSDEAVALTYVNSAS